MRPYFVEYHRARKYAHTKGRHISVTEVNGWNRAYLSTGRFEGAVAKAGNYILFAGGNNNNTIDIFKIPN